MEDLSLADETFAVKSLSHNVARDHLSAFSISEILTNMTQITRANPHTGTSPKSCVTEPIASASTLKMQIQMQTCKS
jgi:hypothetical protein